MGRCMRAALAAMGVLVLAAGAARAQGLTERVDRLEKAVRDQRKNLAASLGIGIHGFVAADYLYNFNTPKPRDRGNGLRVFDEDADSFTLNQANLHVDREADDGIGFLTDLDFGKTAEVVGRVTRWESSFDSCLGSPPCGSSESTNSFELRQAVLSYKVPLGDGVTLKGGKFVTLHGAEVIKSYNNFNYNISNSIMFGYSIPFAHTGIMASAPFGEVVTVDLGVVNGWDNVVDNNGGKTLHGGVNLAIMPEFSLYLSGSYGPEQRENVHSKRAMATVMATVKPAENLTLIVDANYGNESDLIPDGMGGLSDADWYGVAAYVIGNVTEELSLILRGEVFNDSDATRTGAIQTAWEVTPTAAYKLSENVTARAEYRHDESNKKFFNIEGRSAVRGQDTVAAEMIFAPPAGPDHRTGPAFLQPCIRGRRAPSWWRLEKRQPGTVAHPRA